MACDGVLGGLESGHDKLVPLAASAGDASPRRMIRVALVLVVAYEVGRPRHATYRPVVVLHGNVHPRWWQRSFEAMTLFLLNLHVGRLKDGSESA